MEGVAAPPLFDPATPPISPAPLAAEAEAAGLVGMGRTATKEPSEASSTSTSPPILATAAHDRARDDGGTPPSVRPDVMMEEAGGGVVAR